jgi:hypothetical protein
MLSSVGLCKTILDEQTLPHNSAVASSVCYTAASLFLLSVSLVLFINAGVARCSACARWSWLGAETMLLLSNTTLR